MNKEITYNNGRIVATTKIIVNGILPYKIYDFMLTLDKEKFIQWHPKDHIDFKVIKQSEIIKGNIFYFHELIGGKFKLENKWEIIDFKKDEMLLMKAQIIIPVFLKLTFHQENNNTVVTHQLQLGFKGLTFINDWIAKKSFSVDRQQASDLHAKQEFKNLELLLQ
jgi:hypothetical protein